MIDENFWPPPEAFLDISAAKQVTDGRGRCVGVAICDDDGCPASSFYQGQRAHFFYEFEVLGPIGVPSGGLEFHTEAGSIVHGKNTFQYGTPAPRGVGAGMCLRYHHVLDLDVLPQSYSFTVGLASADERSYLGYTSGPLTHEQFRGAIVEHCRAIDVGTFAVGFDSAGKLRHHGAANLPGDCNVKVVEAAAGLGHASYWNEQPTIFHVTHWKAGSQWIKKILKDCVPDQLVEPEVREVQFKIKPIQAGMVYPTVYVTRQQFDSVRLPPNWRRFVVIRDLRDTLISGYFSLKVSHPLIAPRLEYWRSMLQQMDVSEGLIYLMDEWLPPSADIQLSWVEAGERLIRYEDLLEHDLEVLEPVLIDECALPVTRDQLRKAVLKNRFERLTRGRERGRENIQAHERKGVAGDWRNYFDDRVKEAFKERFGELLVATGYERDSNW
jgi:hypothetical protein